MFVIRIKIRHEPEVIQRMLDTVMPHIPHQVWEHGIYVSAFPCPAVYGSPGKVMAEIIDAGHFSRPLRKCLLTYEAKVITKCMYRIRFIDIIGEKVLPLKHHGRYLAVIKHQIRNKYISDKYPAAFGAF